jgi:hypothetical protein
MSNSSTMVPLRFIFIIIISGSRLGRVRDDDDVMCPLLKEHVKSLTFIRIRVIANQGSQNRLHHYCTDGVNVIGRLSH